LPIIKRKGKKGFFSSRARLYVLEILGALGILFIIWLVMSWPRRIWYVDEEFLNDWGRILRNSSPPFSRFEPLPPGGSIPKGRYGYIISPNPPGFERSRTGVPVKVYRDLSRTREWETPGGKALVLALDPWMVFRKHQDPEPDRARIESLAGGAGILVIPGKEKGAVWAWLSQLLQGPPGTFPDDPARWEEAGEGLFEGRRFQQGASTYGWYDAEPILSRQETAWLYAPLSRIRRMTNYRMGLLDATMFPVREEWNVYGIQAEVLWAVPFGADGGFKKLDKVEEWLRSARVQTIIADTVGWIPAHPQGVPYNTISQESQAVWIRSSFIWQGAAYERREIE
jgi:hypothetical protein